MYGKRSSNAFFAALLVAVAGGAILAVVQLFIPQLHKPVIAGVTGFIGGALLCAAALATWKKLS